MARAKGRLIDEAKSVKVYDSDATEDREAIYAAIRSAGAKMPAAPPPNFGQMSDQEFAAYKRGFGF